MIFVSININFKNENTFGYVMMMQHYESLILKLFTWLLMFLLKNYIGIVERIIKQDNIIKLW